MFYETAKVEELRFGDVLRGYVLANTKIVAPISALPHSNYQIEVSNPSFVVVLSPCCSIGDKMILLTPLIDLKTAGKRIFLDNPYFAKDLRNINRKMDAQNSVTPERWAKFSDEERAEKSKEGVNFALLEYFIYEQHPIFPEYPLTEKEEQKKKYPDTNYYMIDFRNTYKVSCDIIIKGNSEPIKSKVLQLSINARSELRDKIAHFYSRVPQEDIISAA